MDSVTILLIMITIILGFATHAVITVVLPPYLAKRDRLRKAIVASQLTEFMKLQSILEMRGNLYFMDSSLGYRTIEGDNLVLVNQLCRTLRVELEPLRGALKMMGEDKYFTRAEVHDIDVIVAGIERDLSL